MWIMGSICTPRTKWKSSLNVKTGVHIVTTGFWNVNLILQFDRHQTEIWKPELKSFLDCSLKLFTCTLFIHNVWEHILLLYPTIQISQILYSCHKVKVGSLLFWRPFSQEVYHTEEIRNKNVNVMQLLGIHFIADMKIYVTIFMWQLSKILFKMMFVE
jgi:hypothetical protein